MLQYLHSHEKKLPIGHYIICKSDANKCVDEIDSCEILFFAPLEGTFIEKFYSNFWSNLLLAVYDPPLTYNFPDKAIAKRK
jgi:hypothetical protein